MRPSGNACHRIPSVGGTMPTGPPNAIGPITTFFCRRFVNEVDQFLQGACRPTAFRFLVVRTNCIAAMHARWLAPDPMPACDTAVIASRFAGHTSRTSTVPFASPCPWQAITAALVKNINLTLAIRFHHDTPLKRQA
jgi:hypothetical protein